jgi:hypothetical protein
MAKKSKSDSVSRPRTRTRTVYRRVRSAGKRAKSGMLGGKLKIGEAILSALVGYEGGNILNGTPLPALAYDKIPQWASFVNSDYSGPHGPGGTVMNKTFGALALAKVGYDVVKSHRLSDEDLNLLIPYALGTVMDKGNISSTTGGAW